MSVLMYPGGERATRGGAPLRSPLLPDVSVGPVRVFIAYDDLPAGRRAMEVVGQLAEHSGDRFDLQPSFWRFDVLEDDACRNEAADEAEAADVIFVGMSQPSASARIDAWLELVLMRREACSIAVVALFPASALADAGIAERNKAIAEICSRHGADFLSARAL